MKITPILLRVVHSVAALLLCSCIFGVSDANGPAPDAPEAFIQANAAKWKAYANRAYAVEYESSSIDGTETITCQSEQGKVTGQCLRVFRCCGEDPESTYVDPTFPGPDDLLSSLAKNVAQLQYDSSQVTDSSLIVIKHVLSGPDTLRIGYYAQFDRQYGYPTEVVYLGPSSASIVQIKRIQFQ